MEILSLNFDCAGLDGRVSGLIEAFERARQLIGRDRFIFGERGNSKRDDGLDARLCSSSRFARCDGDAVLDDEIRRGRQHHDTDERQHQA